MTNKNAPYTFTTKAETLEELQELVKTFWTLKENFVAVPQSKDGKRYFNFETHYRGKIMTQRIEWEATARTEILAAVWMDEFLANSSYFTEEESDMIACNGHFGVAEFMPFLVDFLTDHEDELAAFIVEQLEAGNGQ